MTQEATSHLVQFWRKPAADKLRALRYHFKTQIWNRLFPSIPLPTRLPYGGWWLARNDALSDAVFSRSFNGPDVKFLRRFLRKDTNVIDIGAHTGFYTLLMSAKVGARGRVLAFEPSPREFSRLKSNIRVNRRANIQVENLALADRNGTIELYVIGPPWNMGSLRPPNAGNVERVDVRVASLDAYLAETPFRNVDVMKMDTEGAELKILSGAAGLLSQSHRPVIVCEINDPIISDGGWEHRGVDVIEFLEARGFRWFSFDGDGTPTPLVKSSWYATDLVAVPEERLAELDRIAGS